MCRLIKVDTFSKLKTLVSLPICELKEAITRTDDITIDAEGSHDKRPAALLECGD